MFYDLLFVLSAAFRFAPRRGFLIVFLVGFGVVLKLGLGLGFAWAWVWACVSLCVCVWVWSWAWDWAVTVVWVQDVFVCFQNRLV